MEFYSASKKKEMLSLVTTTWMKPEDMMLSEIGQPKNCMVSLRGRLQSNPTQKQRVEWWLTEVGCGENREMILEG